MVVIAALFAAFAVIAAVAIDRGAIAQQTQRQLAASAQLSRISTALVRFSISNSGRYPCPAAFNLPTSDANYGVSVTSCESGTPSGIDILTGSSSEVIRGIVPVVALATFGLDPSDGIDPWGNRIMYVVNRNLTPAGSGTATVRPTVLDRISNLTLNAPDFIVISYGRDKLGAIQQTSIAATIACPATTDARANNCNGDSIFLYGPAYTASNAVAGNYFDDIVSFYAAQ